MAAHGNEEKQAREAVAAARQPLLGAGADYDALLDRIGDARFVLIGEASHGTHEFYNERARLTRRLIEEKGFHAVAVEADWPDAYRVNRFLRGHGGDDPLQSLGDFTRFPLWMWRNSVVLDFVTDLGEYNATVPQDRTVGFYGLDLYSLYGSIAAVVAYLEKADPEAARRARDRYGCLEFFAPDPQRYGMEASFGLRDPCEEEAIAQLVELQRKAGAKNRVGQRRPLQRRTLLRYAKRALGGQRGSVLPRHVPGRARYDLEPARHAHGRHAGRFGAAPFAAARRTGQDRGVGAQLPPGRCPRDRDGRGARRTEPGQLTRERHGREVFLVGMSTYTGTVTAAHDWDGPAQRKRVRPGLPGSLEALFHEAASENTSSPNFWLDLRGDARLREALAAPRLERAIGVIYRPQTERWSHYFHCRVAAQFDALLHFDETTALQPLDRTSGWEEEGELADTFPTGI